MLKELKIERSLLNDLNLISVAWLVSRFQPFYTYSFGLMMDKLFEQLRARTNITISESGKIVAYADWYETDLPSAENWQKNNLEKMPATLQGGDAVIVTVVVTQNPKYLRTLIRAISHSCAGKKAFRKRTFHNAKPDMIRPPITGRAQI